MGLFGPSIEYELKCLDARDVHGYATDADFDSYRKLKRHVKQFFKNFACPSCGNHKVSGAGLVVTYGKVHLYHQVESKGWFGRRKYKDQKHKTVWRMHDIALRNAPGRALLNLFGALDPPPGELECHSRGCEWTMKGERGGTWSLADIWQAVSKS